MKRFLTNKLNQVLVLVLTIAALLTGQEAAANSEITYNGQGYTIFDDREYYTATIGSMNCASHIFINLVDNVYDGHHYTYWLMEEDRFTEKFIEFYSDDILVPKGYRLRTGMLTDIHPNRRPKSWTLKGKKREEDEWIVLATVTGDTQLPAAMEKSADYWIADNTEPCRYFRFEITEIQDREKIQVTKHKSITQYVMELSDLQIIGDKYDLSYDLDYARFSGIPYNYDYTGKDIVPNVTVYNFYGATLTEGKDYTLSYTFNGETVTAAHDIGTYTATATAISPCVGQHSFTFRVVEALLGEGTEENPYLISNANDWYLFDKKYIQNEHSDAYFKLADDFDNSKEPITEMIATDKNNPFRATLDGNGRTLHIALKSNSDDGCAPFRYLKAATFRKLTVAGYAATSSKNCASIAVENLNDGDNFTTIADCYSKVFVTSNKEGDGTNGGFVALNHGKLSFLRSAFLGRLLGKTATGNGGFVGWNDDGCELKFRQCIFDPIWVTMSETDSKTFSRYDTTKPRFPDPESYFTYTEWGTNQGTQAVALTTPPANLGNVEAIDGKMTRYEHGLQYDGIFYVTNLGFYDDANNSALLREANGRRVNVTLTGRTLFKDGNWNALCLPFDLGSDYVANFLGNGGKLMELDTEGEYASNRAPAENGTSQTGFDPATGTLRLYFKEATEIKAGTPYIIKWPSGTDITNGEFPDVIIDNSTDALIRQNVESADGRVLFSGTFSPVELPNGDKSNLFFASGNELQCPGTDGYLLKSFRAFFHVDLSDGASINAIDLHFGNEGEATGIINCQLSIVNSSEADVWYSLDGRKIANGQKPKAKGLYINNGKKIIIK